MITWAFSSAAWLRRETPYVRGGETLQFQQQVFNSSEALDSETHMFKPELSELSVKVGEFATVAAGYVCPPKVHFQARDYIVQKPHVTRKTAAFLFYMNVELFAKR